MDTLPAIQNKYLINLYKERKNKSKKTLHVMKGDTAKVCFSK
jgi:hypothetical protein